MKTKQGISLIVLVITIIVMVILATVVVVTLNNTGIIGKAKDAVDKTQAQQIEEAKVLIQAEGMLGENPEPIVIGTTEIAWDARTQKAITYKVGERPVVLPSGIEEVAESNIPAGWNTSAVIAITDGRKIVPLPKGFSILEIEGKETTVANGLVIKDNNTGNEFVWIPVENAVSYTEDSFGPVTYMFYYSNKSSAYDSQDTLNYLYGTNFYNYANDFTYAQDKTNVENSIKKYGGFYVGRYETTYESTNSDGIPQGVGVKPNKPVLTDGSIIKAGTNANNGDSSYYFRWWGLYKAQKSMYANNSNVGSLMISSKQWDAIMSYTRYGSAERATNTYTTTPDLSGSEYKDVTPATYDETHNIYDLAGNVREHTINLGDDSPREIIGGAFNHIGDTASTKYSNAPDSASNSQGSRSSLYIK